MRNYLGQFGTVPAVTIAMSHTYTNLVYHIVFSTKERFPSITPDIREELYNYMGGVIRGENGVLFCIGGMPDHVHIATKFRASISVSDMLRKIKAHSSKWIHERHQNQSQFQWQNGFGAFSVSESQIQHVVQYIQNQETHHRQKTFQEEYVEFLIKQNIQYDEKYLWD